MLRQIYTPPRARVVHSSSSSSSSWFPFLPTVASNRSMTNNKIQECYAATSTGIIKKKKKKNKERTTRGIVRSSSATTMTPQQQQQQHHHPIAKLVSWMSSVHQTSSQVMAGKMTPGEVMRSTVLAPKNFPMFLAFCMGTSLLAGNYTMEYILKKQGQYEQRLLDEYYEKHQRYPNEVNERAYMLQAMIDNAKNSTWRENLENASDAQDRFMLGTIHSFDDDDGGIPKFQQEIRKRAQVLRRQHTELRAAMKQQQHKKNGDDTSSSSPPPPPPRSTMGTSPIRRGARNPFAFDA